jgi:selenocysteine-specific elongation factor
MEGTEAHTDVLEALVEEGRIVRVGSDALLTREDFDRLVRETLELIDRDGHISAAGLRDALGLSRKFAVAFLEHLDGQRVTRRVGDERVRGSRAPACV